MKKLCIALLMTGLAGVCHASEVTPASATAKSFRAVNYNWDLIGETVFPNDDVRAALLSDNQDDHLAVLTFIEHVRFAADEGFLCCQYAHGYLEWMEGFLTSISEEATSTFLARPRLRFDMFNECRLGILSISKKNLVLRPHCLKLLTILMFKLSSFALDDGDSIKLLCQIRTALDCLTRL